MTAKHTEAVISRYYQETLYEIYNNSGAPLIFLQDHLNDIFMTVETLDEQTVLIE